DCIAGASCDGIENGACNEKCDTGAEGEAEAEAEGEDCCDPSDPCDWANDGVCDCSDYCAGACEYESASDLALCDGGEGEAEGECDACASEACMFCYCEGETKATDCPDAYYGTDDGCDCGCANWDSPDPDCT
ncbi:MAG: hypothetical protein AABZ30_07295, partial [Myxococcota bacterium]